MVIILCRRIYFTISVTKFRRFSYALYYRYTTDNAVSYRVVGFRRFCCRRKIESFPLQGALDITNKLLNLEKKIFFFVKNIVKIDRIQILIIVVA